MKHKKERGEKHMARNRSGIKDNVKSVRFLWQYVKDYRWQLVVVTIMIVISTYFQVVSPLLLGDAIDALANYVTSGFIPGGDTEAAFASFTQAIGFLIAAFLATAIGMFVQNFMMSTMAGKATNAMRIELFRKLESLSIRFFDQSSDGEIQSNFTNDIDNISTMMSQSLIQVLSNIALLIGIIIMMLRENITLALVTLIMGPIVIFLSSIVVKKAKVYVDAQQARLSELNGYIDEKISGQKVIISYGLEAETIDDFLIHNEALKKTSIKGQIYSGILFPMIQGISLVNTAMIIFVGSTLAIEGTVTIGLLVAFVQYSQRFFQPLSQIASQYNLLQLALTGANRVSNLFSQQSDVTNQPAAEPITKISGAVELEHVSFGYVPEKPVLKDISMTVKRGQMVALVGPTGSGKTTVMNLMNRFYDVDSGMIAIDGKNIQAYTLESLREKVGIVLQEATIFSGTIRENICYGKREATQAEVETAAKLANLHEFIMSLESGYETEVTNATNVFSTGQKQLLSIARTILTDPDLLILDEATSNVDTVTEAKIQKAMDNVLQGRTSFVIAHRLKTILRADVIIVLRDGEIIERGNHQALMALDGFYAELYHNQFVE